MQVKNSHLSVEEIFLNLPCGLWWIDRDHHFLGCNIECCGFVRLNPQEFLGKTIIEVGKSHDSFLSKSLTQEVYDSEERVMQTGVAEFQVMHTVTHGPEEPPICQLCTRKPILNAKGEVVGMLGAGVLERHYDQQFKIKLDQLTEDHFIVQDHSTINFGFREAFQMMPASLFWMDREHKYLGCNLENCRVLGIFSQRELIGKTILDIAQLKRWPPLRAENVYDLDESIMQMGTPAYSIENITPQGQKAPALRQIVAKKPIFNNNGEVIGLMGAAIYDGRFGEPSKWSSLG